MFQSLSGLTLCLNFAEHGDTVPSEKFQSLSGLTLCLNPTDLTGKILINLFQSLSGLTLCLNGYASYDAKALKTRFNPFQG